MPQIQSMFCNKVIQRNNRLFFKLFQRAGKNKRLFLKNKVNQAHCTNFISEVKRKSTTERNIHMVSHLDCLPQDIWTAIEVHNQLVHIKSSQARNVIAVIFVYTFCWLMQGFPFPAGPSPTSPVFLLIFLFSFYCYPKALQLLPCDDYKQDVKV